MTSSQQFQSNQFNNNVPVKGDTAMTVGFNTMPVLLDPNSVSTVVAGDAVVLTTSDGTAILVDKATAAEVPWGFIVYEMKNNIYSVASGKVAFEIARFGTLVWAEAQGSVDRGDDLEYVPDGTTGYNPLIKVNAGTNPICGIAVDNASDGELFRMMIITAIDFTPTIVGGSINNSPIGQTTPNLGSFTVLQATTSLTVSGNATVTTIYDAIVALTPAATISVNPALGGCFTLTPTASCTLNAASVPAKHQRICLVITTSGTNSYIITFGTSFKTQGTLQSGTVSGKVFCLTFDCDGTNFNELSDRTAM